MSKRVETSQERFKRLATMRTNAVLRRLRILGNCANRQIYSYTQAEVEKVFSTIERQVKEIRAKFHFPKNENFRL
ncbi:MAG: hypothetical protein AMS15_05185 [Planctomycetes bacterium DG_23]|nr:MAG: hypothetical protein AMS15_05185 [Planctomycetes bacterium DG_23]